MPTMIDIVFNAGTHAEEFAHLCRTLQVSTLQGVDGVNVKFTINADHTDAEQFRSAAEALYAANFGADVEQFRSAVEALYAANFGDGA